MEPKEQTHWHNVVNFKDILSYAFAIIFGALIGLAICKII